MKRIDINSHQTHFIGCWDLKNKNLCDELIRLFENNKNLQKSGTIGRGVNTKIKKTIDITFNPNDLKNPKFEILKQYIKELHKCYLDYRNQWPFLASMLQNIDIGRFNIQKYSRGDHFAQIHSERVSINTSHRLFAWMTYLNDVVDGGETRFSHYKINIKPKTGKTLIWPAEWTHAHAGEVLNSGDKYIITGWMHFPPPKIK